MVLEQAAGLDVLGQLESKESPWSLRLEDGRLLLFEGFAEQVDPTDDSPSHSPRIDSHQWDAIMSYEIPAIICINGPTVQPNIRVNGCKLLFWFSSGYDAEYFVFGADGEEYGSVEFVDGLGVRFSVTGIGSQTKLQLVPAKPPIDVKRYMVKFAAISEGGELSSLSEEGLVIDAAKESALLDVSGPLAVVSTLTMVDEPVPIALTHSGHRALLENGNYGAAALEFDLHPVDSSPAFLSTGLEITFGRYLRGDFLHKTVPGIKAADTLGFIYPRIAAESRIAVLRYAKTGQLFKFEGIGGPKLRITLCSDDELQALLEAQKP